MEKVRINFFCIGLGKQFANYHMSTILLYKDIANVHLFDIDINRIEDAENRINELIGGKCNLKKYKNFKDMIEFIPKYKDSINLFIVSTPIDYHYEYILYGLKSKCYVYTDKPFVRTKQEAKDIVARCKKMRNKVVIGSQRRFETIYRKICSRIPVLGEIKSISFQNHGQFKDINPNSIENDVLVGTGYHIIDTVLWLIDKSIGQIISYSIKGSVAQYWDINPNYIGAIYALIIIYTKKIAIPVSISVSNFSTKDTIEELLKISGIDGEIKLSRSVIPRNQIPGEVKHYFWDETTNKVVVEILNNDDTYDRAAPLKQLINNLVVGSINEIEATAEDSELTVEIIEKLRKNALYI